MKIPLRKVFKQTRVLEVLAKEAVRADGHEKSPEEAPRQLCDAQKENEQIDQKEVTMNSRMVDMNR